MHIPLRMLLCSGWNRCTSELLLSTGTRRKVLFLIKFAKRKKKKIHLLHLVHCNPINPSTNSSVIWTQGLDGTITFGSGASLCSLKVREKTGPSNLPQSRDMATLLFEHSSLPRLKNLAPEDKKEDFSALKGRPSYRVQIQH